MSNQVYAPATALQPVTFIEPQAGFTSMLQGSLSSSQLVFGALSLIIGIAICVVDRNDFGYKVVNDFIGAGIWVGVFTVITGVLGITTFHKNNFCAVITSLVMNIVSALMAVALLGVSTWMLLMNKRLRTCEVFYNRPASYYDRRYNIYKSWCDGERAILSMESLLIGIGVAKLILGITTSVICCASVCCCTDSQNTTAVRRLAAPRLPVAVYTASFHSPDVYFTPTDQMTQPQPQIYFQIQQNNVPPSPTAPSSPQSQSLFVNSSHRNSTKI